MKTLHSYTDGINRLLDCFSGIPDPRVERTRCYDLKLLLFTALCTFLTGGVSCCEMALFAARHKKMLSQFFPGQNVTPSHDTFNRVFAAVNKEALAEAMEKSARLICCMAGTGKLVAVDGKTIRGAAEDGKAPHVVTVWSAEDEVVLKQGQVPEKTNEIPEVARLLASLGEQIAGTVVMADALNTQKNTVEVIVRKCGANWIMPVKGNHQGLFQDISLMLDREAESRKPDAEDVDKGHGRHEVRKVWQTENIGWINEKEEWTGLRSIFLVEKETTCMKTGKKTVSRRYYMTSFGYDPQSMLYYSREYWSIENRCHWRLDVVMREDSCRARKGNIAVNFRTVRSICLNVMHKIRKTTAEFKDRSMNLIMKSLACDINRLMKALSF